MWRTGPRIARRGVCIVFRAPYLQSRYPDLLARCGNSLGLWLGSGELQLRDFDVPLLPVMQAGTAALLSTRLEGQFRHAFVSSTTEQLLCLALSALADRTSQSTRLSTRDREIIQSVRRIFDESLADPPRVEDLAKRFGINRNKLRCGFKDIFGASIAEYWIARKMRIAFELLEQEHRSVSEVSACVGYDYLCNFTTAFKRWFGQTPREVAKRRDLSMLEQTRPKNRNLVS